ncbi:hypothetical protein ANN_06789 [Periplaneta americana]|uniref:Mos1 transposase HTH domain-containing protein n=1 Tax=Periplaneta americana TaxID=6978 RepID=A0ABQ8TH19_PERAM|nr:hypothetical protein ANN_06789 [Periplaneta americana]
MSPGSSTESYPAFARIGLRENPGKNLNQVTSPTRIRTHLASRPDVLTVAPQGLRDLGRIDTQHAMHMTGSVNRLRPVERSQCERKCHSAMEQRVNIKFCYKLGKTATETHGMLVQVYGREVVSRKCVYEWFKRFREGKETIEDEPRSGRPSTSRTPEMIEKVRQMLTQDQRLTLRSIAE